MNDPTAEDKMTHGIGCILAVMAVLCAGAVGLGVVIAEWIL